MPHVKVGKATEMLGVDVQTMHASEKSGEPTDGKEGESEPVVRHDFSDMPDEARAEMLRAMNELHRCVRRVFHAARP
jgi:hypothetical protein